MVACKSKWAGMEVIRPAHLWLTRYPILPLIANPYFSAATGEIISEPYVAANKAGPSAVQVEGIECCLQFASRRVLVGWQHDRASSGAQRDRRACGLEEIIAEGEEAGLVSDIVRDPFGAKAGAEAASQQVRVFEGHQAAWDDPLVGELRADVFQADDGLDIE